METYAIKDLTFAYPNNNAPVLRNLSFSVGAGEFVALTGPSGCGKTTLLRWLKPSLTPQGLKSGGVTFEGKALDSLDFREQSQKIGFVAQSPDNQIVTDKVWHEMAFGLESLGMDTPAIRRRVAEMASYFGIQTWFHLNVAELSGGQKQILNLASVMAMQPSVLILDEPTGQLDPIAAADFLAMVGKLNRELGVTVIITEHRLEEVFPHAGRVLVMDMGEIIADGPAARVGAVLKERGFGMLAGFPVPMRVFAAVDSGDAGPVTVKEGKDWLAQQTIVQPLTPERLSFPHEAPPALEFEQVWFRFAKDAPDVLKRLSFKAYPGEIYALMGGNGTGKSTALSLATGVNRPYRGAVKLFGEEIAALSAGRRLGGLVGMLPQNPQSIFLKNTVAEDLLETFEDKKLPREEKEARITAVVNLCKLERLTRSHPYDLSGGEQQRAALAKVLLRSPQILLLDEPTKGLDAEFKRELAGILRDLAARGAAVVIVSHDLEFCAEFADRCALFFDGGIISEDRPRAFFSGASFYTTAANRMARHILPEAVTAGDVIRALGGKPFVPARPSGGGAEVRLNPPEPPAEREEPKGQKAGGRPAISTIIAILTVLLVIPLTIYIGGAYFGDRKYYFISMLIILEALLPFALIFEKRKPRARELLVLAALCAITVAGRAVFFMLPQFKPVAALVIIAGIACGGEAGFLVGAASAFVSDMFFGQGPWTPWQMFAFGLIGFSAGICFRKGFLTPSVAALGIFGFVATFFIYGGIMNPANVLIFQQNPTREMFYLAYLQGFAFDLIHAAATVFFLAVAAKPMLEKLDRIKLKYGLFSQT